MTVTFTVMVISLFKRMKRLIFCPGDGIIKSGRNCKKESESHGMNAIQLEELKSKISLLTPNIAKLGDALDMDALKKQVQELEHQATAPDFWDDMERAQKIMQTEAHLKDQIEQYENLSSSLEDCQTMLELAQEEDDDELFADLKQSLDEIDENLQRQTLATLLTGEYDRNNAIITLHAGAGGTEAMDWAQMLFRMYARWAERHGFSVKTLDFVEGEEAGLKSISLLISGENAYGYLKGESGVHRLVRVSPFDASGRRHTSFASLEVIPEIDDDAEIEIREEDLKMDVFRSSGAGGQHVNKTSSAVRLTHLPTGIITSCQNERSQLQNRMMALRMLKSKLAEIKEREHLEKIEDIKGEQKEIAWGSQIRSYVFMPYTLAKDHRTGFENGNINNVMDGDLDGFINAYLVAKSQEKLS